MKKIVLILSICGIQFTFVNCPSGLTIEEEKIYEDIRQTRSQKDSLFRHADWSPIPDEEKETFQGLNYFPIDLRWRFEGPITRYDSLIPDTIIGTRGDLRPALKYGYFEFTAENNPQRLEIYKIVRADTAYQNYLFLGFTDKTTGNSTYGTGRYIDLTIRSDNHYVVDFNKSYNPYCAYNPKYTCAIPPDENALPVPVKAGEKIYHQH